MNRTRRLKLQLFRIVVFVVLGAFFLVPFGAMFEFSTRGNGVDAPRTLESWSTIATYPWCRPSSLLWSWPQSRPL